MFCLNEKQMVIKDFFEQLYGDLELQLSHLHPLIEEAPLKNCRLALDLLMEGYEKLRSTYIRQKIRKKDEIDFFKNCKPRLTSWIIYFNELYKMESNKPIGSEKNLRHYYGRELKKSVRFFEEHAEFYRYYRQGHHYLDEQFFLRNRQAGKLAVDSFYFQIDKLFATSHDYWVAQIMAHEQLQSYLEGRLSKKRKPENHDKVLKWTGSKVALIELVYALHTEGVFNHGASDLREIVQVFSKVFDVEIGQFHRTYHELCNRKAARTKFLLSLSEKLLRRMDQADEH